MGLYYVIAYNVLGVGLASQRTRDILLGGMREFCNNRARALLLASLVSLLLGMLLPGASSATLPDGRVDELVSTSGNGGEPYTLGFIPYQDYGVLLNQQLPFQAASDGEAVTYLAEPPVTPGGAGFTGLSAGDQWLANRTPSGWQTGVIEPVDTEPSQRIRGYQAFSPDLSNGITMGSAHQPLVPEVPDGCTALYVRADATGTYRALFNPSEAPAQSTYCGAPLFAGASKDETQVIFQTQAALTPSAQLAENAPPTHVQEEPGERGCTFGCNLYESQAGHLRLVNSVEGVTVPNATLGGYPGPRNSGAPDFSNAISSDGSRVFWTDTQPGPDFEHVYALENGSSTVQVSGGEAAEYWTATPDGRYAYYTEAGMLWRFDTSANVREPVAPAAADVRGVIGTNQSGEDGAYLYFVADGALAPGATQKLCVSLSTQQENIFKESEEGLLTSEEFQQKIAPINKEKEEEAAGGIPPKTGCNLYVRHAGTTRFIAELSPQDDEAEDARTETGPVGDWKASPGERTAELTPDGRHLVFESVRPLTGYDNRSERRRNDQELQSQVFVYDADAARVGCASCDPAGVPPGWPQQEGATRLPVSALSKTYMHRWISDDGNRVFFDSEQALVPQDGNEVQDVYEWEREDTSGCPVATSKFGGCVSLISGGELTGYSFLIDADAAGDNVFFEQRGSLGQAEVGPDRNELYDARVGGGFPKPAVACSGSGCQNEASAPPSFASPPSASFTGTGNLPPTAPVLPRAKPAHETRAQQLSKALKACRTKRDKRRRASCERQARKRYGPVRHAKKAVKTTLTNNGERKQP